MSENYYATKDQLIDILKAQQVPILGAGGGFAPIGTINFFDASIAPQGWLICDGSTHNIADYPDLATFYASVHGASNFYGGNGTTTFAVPDLRGEFLRGAGTNSHTNQGSGANVGVHQDGTEIMAVKNNPNNKIPTGFFSSSDDNNYRNADATKSESYNFIDYRNNTGGAESGTNTYTSRPTNTSFLICVKATLSDTELNNMHVYSPNEHQVSWWQEEVDGVLKQKPVYEKVFTGLNVTTANNNDWFVLIQNIQNIDRIVYLGNMKTSKSSLGNGYVEPFEYEYNNNNIRTSSAWGGRVIIEATLQYTKTTDQWKTV